MKHKGQHVHIIGIGVPGQTRYYPHEGSLVSGSEPILLTSRMRNKKVTFYPKQVVSKIIKDIDTICIQRSCRQSILK